MRDVVGVEQRQQRIGLCVVPPESERRSDEALYRKWSRWGVFDFHSHIKPQPICYAAAFDPDGVVSLAVGTQSNGQGHETAFTQLVTEKLGVPFESITVKQGDSDWVNGGGTGGSRSLNMSGGALYAASKAGALALFDSLAAEVKPYNINVNSVLPSIIDTAVNRKAMPGADFAKWPKPGGRRLPPAPEQSMDFHELSGNGKG